MKKKKSKISAIVIFIIFVVVVVFSLVFVLPEYRKKSKSKKTLAVVNKEWQHKKDQVTELNKINHELGHSPKAIEKVARDKFEKCKPGEVIIKIKKR